MQSLLGESFRRELDQRATSKGAVRMPGFAYANTVGQGYALKGKVLQYILEADEIVLRVTPDAPFGAMLGAFQHALDPTSSADEHEAQMLQEIRLNWSQELQAWLVRKGNDGRRLGLDNKSVFDDENLAQCCANWLCS